MMQKERMQYNIYVSYVGRYRDILQPACCNGSQTRDKEEEDLEIFSMYIGKYKCTRIISKIRCSSETVSFF